MARLLVIAVLSAVFVAPSWAVPVVYRIEGDLILLDADDHGLEGAHFVWNIVVNTDYAPYNGFHPHSLYNQYEASDILFTNRPDGLPNLYSEVTWTQNEAPDSSTFLTTNNDQDNPLSGPDRFDLRDNWVIEANGMQTGPIWFLLPKDYWPGHEYVPVPTGLTTDDFVDIQASFWGGEKLGGSHAPINISLSMNVVPLPATAWLFGSALGLLGWVKRRGN